MLFFFVSVCFSYEEYKLCANMSFCHRNIDLTKKWSLDENTIKFANNEFTADLLEDGKSDQLKLIVYLMQENSFRVQFIPTNTEKFNRYKTSDNSLVVDQTVIHQHCDLTHTLDDEQTLSTSTNAITSTSPKRATNHIHVLKSAKCAARIAVNPFKITVIDEYNSSVVLNSRQELVFEHTGEYVGPDIWPYYRNDTIKNGATSVGIDFAFPGANTRLLGFSESDDFLNLKDTPENEPKRVSNVDYFSEYGHIPLVYGHSPNEMAAFFWMNPSDTFLKIKSDSEKDERLIRVLSEGGYADIVVFTGKINQILKSYTELTGHHEMPPMFALGYHQSKWGYKTQNETEIVIDRLDGNDYPFDVIWLDVDHLKGHAPFKFDEATFPNPDKLFRKLSKRGRYLVRLNDPHLPNSTEHSQYQYALSHGYFVNETDGVTVYQGWCWPGASSWPDFLNPVVHKWWSSLYAYEQGETAANVYFWNDMNEPSIFNTVEGTFPKDLLMHGGYEAREIHSLYGLLMHSATYGGVVARNEGSNVRPFILTRSYFAGSQKFTWMWSGDNTASFDHLRKSVAMSIVAGLCGMPLTGADLGGFNGNPSEELLYRWYQAGAFAYPLYRSHCHEDSLHREPYLYSEHIQEILRNTTILRYKFAPLWYSAIHKSHLTGLPPVLPLFALFPDNYDGNIKKNHNDGAMLHDNQEQFVLGEALMAAPVLYENAHKIEVVKPPGVWYDFHTGNKLEATGSINVTDTSLPIYLRGGKVVATYSEVGTNMQNTAFKSPIILYIACDENGNAEGSFYFDDGISYDYRNGTYMDRKLIYRNNKLSIELGDEGGEKVIPQAAKDVFVNEIIFFGAKEVPELIGNAAVYCKGEVCEMKNIKVYLYMIEKAKEKTSYTVYIIIGSVVAVLIIIAVVSFIIIKKRKQKHDQNLLNISNENLLESK